jgi:hypothetical protein
MKNTKREEESTISALPDERHIVDFVCSFCGNRWKDEYHVHTDKVIDLPGCRICVAPLSRGVQVKYAAPERAQADAIYADRHLTRDAIYTIAKVKRWQHGAYVSFKETGDKQFNSRLFVPRDFEKKGESQ